MRCIYTCITVHWHTGTERDANISVCIFQRGRASFWGRVFLKVKFSFQVCPASCQPVMLYQSIVVLTRNVSATGATSSGTGTAVSASVHDRSASPS